MHAMPICMMLGELVDLQRPQQPATKERARQGQSLGPWEPSCTCPMHIIQGQWAGPSTPSQKPGSLWAFGWNSRGAGIVMGGLHPSSGRLAVGPRGVGAQLGSSWPAELEGESKAGGARRGLRVERGWCCRTIRTRQASCPLALPGPFHPQPQPS